MVLVTAALMAIAFFGFGGLILRRIGMESNDNIGPGYRRFE